MPPAPRLLAVAAVLAACTALGCASAPEVYQPTEPHYVEDQIEFANASPQIEQGRDLLILDGLNHYVLSLPTKLLLLNWKLQDHEFPEHDRVILESYLAINQLTSVKVRVNQYAPIGEWQRMWSNTQVGFGYRATLGMLTWLRYTLFPDRVFGGLPIPFVGGGDHFNPYTNTIHLFSSDLGVVLHEAGHAKDYIRHRSRGTTFALARLVPGVDLFQEARASQDAIQYLYCRHQDEAEVRAYRTLIPAYSTYIAGYFSGGLVVTLPVVAAGHVSGRTQGAVRARDIESERDAPNALTRRDLLPAFCTPIDVECEHECASSAR